MSSLHEQDFNQGLAKAMTSCYATGRIQFVGEAVGRLARGRSSPRADVVVSGFGLLPVAVEGEYLDKPGCNPDKDALDKLGILDKETNRSIQAAVAVCYPKTAGIWKAAEVDKKLLQGAVLQYAVFTQYSVDEPPIRFPDKGYMTGDVRSLTELAVLLTNPYFRIIEIAKNTSVSLGAAMQNLSDNLALDSSAEEALAVAIGRPSQMDSFPIISMIWLNAFLFQDRMAAFYRNDIPRRSDLYGYTKILPTKTYQAWQSILNINYSSIYKPASDTLKILMSKSSARVIAAALTIIADNAEKIDIESLGLFDIGGELFQEVISDRDDAASYYTKPAIAEFLSRIVAHKLPSVDLKAKTTNYSKQGDLKIGDFACGTGTLLRAIHRRLLALCGHENLDPQSTEDLHLYMMEQGFCGVDISPIAAHLTASGLSNTMPQAKYRNTNIGVISVGGRQGKTGSIEFLSESEQPDLLRGTSSQASLLSETVGPEDAKLVVSAGTFDVVVMNPPYQRARGQQKQFDVAGVTEKDRQLAIKRCRQICSRIDSVNLQAGLSNVFCELVLRSLNTGGRLGIILPMTAAQALSWSKMRQQLETSLDDLTIFSFASGASGGEHSLSADTNMGEIMLTGTRRAEKLTRDTQNGITFVVIDNPLNDITEAVEIARSVNKALDNRTSRREGHIRLGDANYGYWTHTSTNSGEPWSYVGVSNFALINLAKHLVKTGELIPLDSSQPVGKIPMTTIESLFNVGPTHDLIGHPVGGDNRGQYEMHRMEKSGIHKVVSLWSADSESQTQVAVKPTHYGLSIHPDDKKQIKTIQDSASTLFYQRNVRWTSQKILVAKTSKPALGGRAWTSLQGRDKRLDSRVLEFAFAVFANSTLGLLIHWTYTQRQQAGRSLAQVKAIPHLPCLDISDKKIYKNAQAAMSEHPDLFEKKLDRLLLADRDKMRQKINTVLVQILGLSDRDDGLRAVLQDIATAWCSEPSVRGGSRG